MIKTDILIVGSGCSGLYCALQCPKDKDLLLISKSDLESSDSYLSGRHLHAQGRYRV